MCEISEGAASSATVTGVLALPGLRPIVNDLLVYLPGRFRSLLPGELREPLTTRMAQPVGFIGMRNLPESTDQ